MRYALTCLSWYLYERLCGEQDQETTQSDLQKIIGLQAAEAVGQKRAHAASQLAVTVSSQLDPALSIQSGFKPHLCSTYRI